MQGMYCKIIVAIPVGQVWVKDLFFQSSEGPPKCKEGHNPEHPGQKFCPFDGKPFEKATVWTPRPFFADAAQAAGMEPEKYLDQFFGYDAKFKFHVIDAVRGASGDKPGTAGFGIEIKELPYLCNKIEPPFALSPADFTLAAEAVVEAAKPLQIVGAPQVFVCCRVVG